MKTITPHAIGKAFGIIDGVLYESASKCNLPYSISNKAKGIYKDIVSLTETLSLESLELKEMLWFFTNEVNGSNKCDAWLKKPKGQKFVWKKTFNSINYANVFDIVLRWKNVGTEGSRIKGYVSFYLSGDGVKIINANTVSIETNNGDTAILTMDKIKWRLPFLMSYKPAADFNTFSAVEVPNVSFVEDNDFVKDIIGVTYNHPYMEKMRFEKACQKTTFAMDKVGATVKVVTTISMLKGATAEPKVLVFDKPFTILLYRNGLTIPYFIAKIAKKDWQKGGVQ